MKWRPFFNGIKTLSPFDLRSLFRSRILLLLFSLLLSLAQPCSANEKDKPLVTCHLWGGLGNQLFLVATTMAYAWDYDALPIFPDLNRSDSHLPFNKEAIFFRLDAPLHPPRPFINSFSESVWHSSEKVPFQPDQILYGYYQSWKHFHHHREKILALFSPRESTLNELKTKYAELLNHPNTVSIHVRTFNKRLHLEKSHPFIGLEYYQRAMALFPSDALFVIFSDRINWCKKHFSLLGRPCIFIEEKDSIKELFLMSMMKHQIICNSTFSWWAAYMNQNPDQIVAAPKSWMHPDFYDFPPPQPNDFYLPHWTIVEQNYDEPFPLDMTWYDTSTSLDGN